MNLVSEKTFLRKQIEEIVRSLIYHGRHFSPSRDAVVVRKAADAIEDMFDMSELGEAVKLELSKNLQRKYFPDGTKIR